MFGLRGVLVPRAMRTRVCSPMRATRRRARLQGTRVQQDVVRPAFQLLVSAKDLLHPSGRSKILEDGGASQVKDNGANDANIEQLQKQEKKNSTRTKCPECKRIRDMPDAFSTCLPNHCTCNLFITFANSSPLSCASFEPNLYLALCAPHHFNV